MNWIPNIRHGGVLHYENLIHDREGQLRKLLHYLNVPVDEQRMKCALKHDYSTFRRNATFHHSMSVIKKYFLNKILIN